MLRQAGPKQDHNTMADDLKFQLRLTLIDEFAQVARNDPGDPSIVTLTDVLKRHDAVMKCQFDAFADYVSEAEASGIENFPLYEWTKRTIEDSAKKAKYTKSFALYVYDGGDEVYEKDQADALEAESNLWSEVPSSLRCSNTIPIRPIIHSHRVKNRTILTAQRPRSHGHHLMFT